MIFAVIILSILLGISVYYNYKFGTLILKIEDALENCLDTIDEKYESMTEILSRPLFFDSPEVKKVVEDVRSTKDSLHQIAFLMFKNFDKEQKDKNDNSGQEEN